MTSEEYDRLTDEEKRIKVAELTGEWSRIQMSEDAWPDGIEEGWVGPGVLFGHRDGVGHPNHLIPLPDYLNDLNAMHEAEKRLTGDRRLLYIDCLTPMGNDFERREGCFATASERARAFVESMTTPEGEDQ